jgi:hypothetical protein
MWKLSKSAIVGYIALIVLLSAGAAQGLSGSDTVYGGDVVNGTLSGADIRDNSLTGTDVKESTLRLSCPSGMSVIGSVCYGSLRSPGTKWALALADCADEKLRLPTVAEGQVVEAVTTDYLGIWTDNYFFQGSTEMARIAGEIPAFTAITESVPYRCVTTVGARP